MLDIGKELKELRISKNLTLKEISEITKINLKYLEYLEDNNFTFLPEVYVKAFLKNYIKALDGDEKKFLEMLDEILHPSASKQLEEEDISAEKLSVELEEKPKIADKFLIGKTNILTIRNVSFVISALLVLIIISFLIFRQETKEGISSDQNLSEQMYVASQGEKSKNFDNIASSDSLILGINAKDSVWIQVRIDDMVLQEVYLRIGESKKFKAKNNFQLLVGNAGGIKLYLNENELPFTGVKGSVRRLKIDKNGVELIQVKNEPQKQ